MNNKLIGVLFVAALSVGLAACDDSPKVKANTASKPSTSPSDQNLLDNFTSNGLISNEAPSRRC